MKNWETQTKKQQTIITSIASSSSSCNEQKFFNTQLCKAMVESNIPLNKLQHKSFKTFLETFCNKHIPDESTLRKNYVASIYQDVIQKIKSIIGDNYIWFSVDETTDSCGRYVENLIIGVLSDETPSKSYLIRSKELEKTNNNTITRFIHDGLTNFFLPEAVPDEKILLMLSDAAPYMSKAACNLKIFYENLIHCTCLAHGINRVAETIRLQFPTVNKLIKKTRKNIR